MLNGQVGPMGAESYCRYAGDVLVNERGEPAASKTSFIHQQFRSLVTSEPFPCVGAKAALQRNTYRFGVFGELGSSEATSELLPALQKFVAEQEEIHDQFATFVASFDGPSLASEEDFEAGLWRQLQALADQDRANVWADDASSDPSDPKFAFSVAGRSYFIVGLSPAASRWSRRFAWPTLVFNAHYQFERLKTDGRFERMQKVIRFRDAGLQGGINPQLALFGAESEARQYSGRATPTEWRCPFRAPTAENSKD